MKIKKTLSLVSKILFNVTAVLLGLTVLLSTIITNETVSTLLTQQVFKDKPEDVIVNTGKEPVRYKTWYSSVEDTLNGNGEIAWLAQAEGTVLLKNENGALPLSAGDKVSLYGVTAYDPMYCLDGAGNNKINDSNAYNGSTEVDRRQFFYDEFKKAGLDVNEKLANWYNSDAGKHYRRRDYVGFWGLNGGLGYSGNKNGVVPALTEANWDEIGSEPKDLGAYGKTTTAIYITGRMSNESLDLNSEGAGSCAPVDGGNNDGVKSQVDYLAFTDDEKNLLQSLGQNYDNVIVIFNQANPPQEDIPKLLEEYGIEGALWIGYPGSDGIKAVAEILTGKINPSGGLSAAWYTSRNANPSTQNYAIGSMDNVVNVEGMYVGYRYAETRYEDTLLSAEYNGNYDYDANISYPFGYGLSYSEFEYTNVELIADPDPEKNYYLGGLMASNHVLYSGNYGKKVSDSELRATGASLGDCDDLIMKVTVKNKNDGVAGKEIVQIYLQQPITEQDKQHGVQKPSVQLIGYGKTKVLEPGQSETVDIKIDANKWFAAYDSRITDGSGNKGGYVLSAGGVLCSLMAGALAAAGAKVALLDRNREAAQKFADGIVVDGGIAKGYRANVLQKDSLEECHKQILADFGKCDILINGAGGNNPRAQTDKEYYFTGDIDADTKSFFDLDEEGVEFVFNLNFIGTLLPTQEFAKDMLGRKGCSILNISSMNAFTPLTKIPAYSGAKAAVSNFTQWLAVHLSKEGIRVNAIAPGFFSTKQNAALLWNADGTPTERTGKILAATPMRRFGEAEELLGSVLFLVSDKAAGFITGIVLPIDGGFSAYSGV